MYINVIEARRNFGEGNPCGLQTVIISLRKRKIVVSIEARNRILLFVRPPFGRERRPDIYSRGLPCEILICQKKYLNISRSALSSHFVRTELL